jgi:CHAT domain-containing protein
MSAALLMIRFYDLYLSGADASPDQKQLHPATALRLAQCWLRDQTYKSLEVYTAELRRRGLIQLAIWVEHYLRVALTPQKDEQMRQREEMRPYAHFYDWAAFVYYGA